MKRLSRLAVRGSVALLAVTLVIQFVPYGRDHTNPPVVAEPSWDAPETRALAARACFDCHSNQTVWPAYATVAPASWLVQRDVTRGRAALNFSEWQNRQKEAGEAAEKVREGDMPLAIYSLMHTEARLTPAEREALAQGLARSVGAEHPRSQDREGPRPR